MIDIVLPSRKHINDTKLDIINIVLPFRKHINDTEKVSFRDKLKLVSPKVDH